MKSPLLLLCLLMLNAFLPAQDLHFEHPNVPSNLLRNRINDLMQDQQGFIWIATTNGLGRYDGEKILEFHHHQNDTTSISDEYVTCLTEDQKGNIWIGTRRGLNLYDPQTATIRSYDLTTEGDPLETQKIQSVLEDHRGYIWVGTYGGLFRLQPAQQQCLYFNNDSTRHLRPLSHNNIYDIIEDAQHRLWLGTIGGISYCENNDSFHFTNILYDPVSPNGLDGDRFFRLVELPNGQLWAGGHDGLFQLIEKDGLQFIRHQHQADQPNSLSYNFIEDIQVDGNGKFWIGTYKGGLNEVLLPETPGDSLQFIHHRSNPSVPSSISSDRVRAVLKDRSGTLWVGTYSGLDKMNPSNRKFEAVAPIPNDPTSLSNKNVRSFATDQKGNLWISTFGGLNFLSAKNLEARNYQFQVFGPDPDNPVSMTNAQGGQLMLDSRNYLWMATFFGHHFIDLETFLDEPTFRWIGTNRNLPHTYTTCTYEIDSVTHWIGTVNGLAKMRYNPKTRKPPPYLKVFHKAPEQPDSLYSDLITEIAKDRFGYFWIATSEGLCRYIPDDGHGRFERYQNNPHDPKSLSSNTIGTFHFDSQKRLWMGTANGLNLLLQESADSPIRFRHFDQSDGLPSENILSIEEDQRGHFWLGTHQGLIHFDPEAALAGKDGLQRFYNHQNGLSESYLLNSHKDANGRMYFSTGNGFIHFDPEQLIQNHHIPPVVLTELKISRKAIHPSNADGSLLPRAIGFTKQLTLQHHQNDIELAFAALDFANATANRYQYQLLGLDDDWVDNGYYNTATYTNLSPGHYTFRVKGSNNDGYWNEEPTELKIYILPPWWLSWWAYLLYLLLFSSIVYAFIRFRVKQRIAALEKQAEIEAVRYEEREQLRKKNAADFHDDLGHRLTKANLFLELATREADTDTRLATLLTKIKTNINGLSEGMRDLIWSLDPQKDTLHQTLARLQEFGDNMFEFSPIEFKTEGIVQQLEKTELAPDVRKHILMIFKEAMNNTLKYSEADKAVLRTQPHNNHWSIVFQDDGKGFQTKATSQGYGLKNMRKRAKTIGAQIEIQSDGQTGTAVVLHLNPKTKRHG